MTDGGRVVVLGLAPGPAFGPEVSDDDLRRAFSRPGWTLEDLRESVYRGRVPDEAQAEMLRVPVGGHVDLPAWLAIARRETKRSGSTHRTGLLGLTQAARCSGAHRAGELGEHRDVELEGVARLVDDADALDVVPRGGVEQRAVARTERRDRAERGEVVEPRPVAGDPVGAREQPAHRLPAGEVAEVARVVVGDPPGGPVARPSRGSARRRPAVAGSAVRSSAQSGPRR